MRILLTTGLILACTILIPHQAQADVITITGAGGVTDFFGNGNGAADSGDSAFFLFDETRAGGDDTGTASNFGPSRTLASNAGEDSNWADGLTTGTAGTVTFDGLGFAMRGGTTNGATISLDIVYLGADEVNGGGDDVTVNAAAITDTVTFSATGEYAWNFSTAQTQTFAWDGLGDRFQFLLTSTGGTMRFKSRAANESPSGQGGLTMSVAGSFTAAAVPEPTSIPILTLVVMGMVTRRRRK